MKKVFLTLGLIGAVAYANAQVSAGRIYIGADLVDVNFKSPLQPVLSLPLESPLIGFSSTSGSKQAGSSSKAVEDPTITAFGLNLNGGYFFKENWAIGAKLGFNMTKTTTKDTITTSPNTSSTDQTTSFTIAPYVRYVMPVKGKFSLLFDGGVSFWSQTKKMTSELVVAPATQPTDEATTKFGVFIAPGVMWMINDNWGVQGNLSSTFIGFTSTNIDAPAHAKDATNKSTTFALNLNPLDGFTAHLGLYYYFGK